MTTSIGVVIVNYNAGPALTACLASVREHLARRTDVSVVVVDNASRDGSLQAGLLACPEARALQLPSNVGFGTAVNRGVAAVGGQHLLLVNPDCRLQSGVVEALQATLDMVETCGIVAPRVLDDDGTVQGSARHDPTPFTGLFGRTSLWTRVFPRSRLARSQIVWPDRLGAAPEGYPVDWVSGACMLVRRDVFTRLGGFDEEFFLYWEDADLCRRAREAGWHTRYLPGVAVFHSVGQSSKGVQAMAVRAFHDSALHYCRKWLAPRSSWLWWVAASTSIRARGWWKVRRARHLQ
jgi:N-acetylglucosaminyl-diphospho-decaprenol L-rhamnosyltransferase